MMKPFYENKCFLKETYTKKTICDVSDKNVLMIIIKNFFVLDY